MLTRVQKWGNSIALRIPKAFAEEMHITPDTPVEVKLEDGRLVVTPVGAIRYTLDELLAGITPENQHEEVDWGEPVGNEVW
jgi:antitoxin MazE